jgi:hypothetical protein
MAYSLAMCDVAVSNHGFISAEFLANRGHSGQWADRAIAALLVDLRHLGPRAIGGTITTSLASAFEEVTTGRAGMFHVLSQSIHQRMTASRLCSSM